MATQAKQAVTEGNRLARTSAAMIGLAVSVGACGLSLSHNGEQAVAAEPSSTDAAASSAPNSFETAAILTPGENSAEVAEADQRIRHTVQEGQTLWDVARFYQIDASTLASVNKLSLDSVLQVGQVLIVPTDTRVAQAATSDSNSAMPGYYGHVPSVVASSLPSDSNDAQLKANQDLAVETLRQKQASLRSSLEQLNARSSQAVGGESAPVIAATEPAPSPSIAVLPSPAPTTPTTAAAAPVITPEVSPSVAMQSSPQFAVSSPAAVGAVSHQVVPGDTLSSIARTHGLTIKQLMQANNISDPDFIFVGQTLSIPAAQASGFATGRLGNAIAAVPRTTTTDVPTAVLPAPMGGAAPQANPVQMAAAPRYLNTAPRPVESTVDSSTDLLQYNHVERLKQEIDRMREQRFQAESARSQSAARNQPVVVTPVAAKAAQPSLSESVNPEFNPDRYAARLQDIRNRIRPVSDRTLSGAPQPRQAPQVLAAAPLGSESYDSVTSRLGQTVSPNLPSLGNGSEFLPSVPGQSENYIWPTKGVLTSGYGPRWGRMHKGIDIAGPVGTPIVAAADGRVTYAGWNSGGYGYLVEIQHPDGSLTLYAHNNRILVQVGQDVSQGDQIAEMGSTGFSTGPHLHFEIHPTGRGAVNPMPFLQARR